MRYLSTVLLTGLLGTGQPVFAQSLPVERLQVPPGYSVELVARVSNARQMALGTEPGVLVVGSRRAGKVVALSDKDGDGHYEQQHLIDRDLDWPSGITVLGDDLYVAALDRILRYPGAARDPQRRVSPELVTDKLPDARHHGWKYLKAGPDGALYTNIGAPCNICLSDDPRFASLIRIDLNNPQPQIIARGVRNSVGFDWHPQDNQLWFTDNGGDHMGDDLPNDELNRLSKPGEHFGYPHQHGLGVEDPNYGDQHAGPFTQPKAGLGAHVAPLGMAFYRGSQFPADKQILFVAEHGSWNRSLKVGYRVTRLTLEGNTVTGKTAFVSGWLQGQRHWGRPTDVLVDRDGSLLISDDFGGAIYRVSYTAKDK